MSNNGAAEQNDIELDEHVEGSPILENERVDLRSSLAVNVSQDLRVLCVKDRQDSGNVSDIK